MQCPNEKGEGVAIILAYLGERLAPETAAALEAHFDECAHCQELLLAQSAVFDALDDWKPQPVSPAFDREVYSRIEAEAARMSWWRSLLPAFGWKPAAVVATACLLLVAGILMRPAANLNTGAVASAEPVDIEQIEQAVEDLEMLYLLEPVLSVDAEAEESPGGENVGAVMLPVGIVRCG